ncbi:snRNA-activating protein complex subunit 5 [Acipenser ruthenus]|uniref:snRNA-activating protein complex subunit 5 n=1 Tax=Acipenser ruthenus TaxID=7906 RepID=A0A444U5D9_ACIRT|nr:snRNA-activating protein complex subunit 5 [Acipenser ruthenus]
MLSRLQELKKEEETLLKVKALLLDQLNRLKFNGGALYLQVEELALQSMISTEREDSDASSPAQPDLAEVGDTPVPVTIAMQVDDESKINQTELQLNACAVEQGLEEEQEEEEEEEEDN